MTKDRDLAFGIAAKGTLDRKRRVLQFGCSGAPGVVHIVIDNVCIDVTSADLMRAARIVDSYLVRGPGVTLDDLDEAFETAEANAKPA
jgi:hypothetical protein